MKSSTLRLNYFIHRGGFFVLLFTVFLNLGWAVLFATADGRLNTIPTAFLISLSERAGLGGQRPGGVVFLLVTSVLAAYGIRHPGVNLRGLGTMLPQVLLLFMSAWSAIGSAIVGRYPDGTVPVSAHQFIGADHLLTILFAFLHAICVVVYHGGGRWTSSRR